MSTMGLNGLAVREIKFDDLCNAVLIFMILIRFALQVSRAKFQAGSAFLAPREECDSTDQDQPIFLVELKPEALAPNYVVSLSGLLILLV